jgi:hypothetical protein
MSYAIPTVEIVCDDHSGCATENKMAMREIHILSFSLSLSLSLSLFISTHSPVDPCEAVDDDAAGVDASPYSLIQLHQRLADEQIVGYHGQFVDRHTDHFLCVHCHGKCTRQTSTHSKQSTKRERERERIQLPNTTERVCVAERERERERGEWQLTFVLGDVRGVFLAVDNEGHIGGERLHALLPLPLAHRIVRQRRRVRDDEEARKALPPSPFSPFSPTPSPSLLFLFALSAADRPERQVVDDVVAVELHVGVVEGARQHLVGDGHALLRGDGQGEGGGGVVVFGECVPHVDVLPHAQLVVAWR